MKCPNCNARITSPAREGGVVVRMKYLRLAGDGAWLKCPNCSRELPLVLPGLAAKEKTGAPDAPE